MLGWYVQYSEFAAGWVSATMRLIRMRTERRGVRFNSRIPRDARAPAEPGMDARATAPW